MSHRRFLVCIHDATPLYTRETRLMIRDLAPLIGRRLCFAVVPNWHGKWPLSAHPDYCRFVRESSEALSFTATSITGSEGAARSPRSRQAATR